MFSLYILIFALSNFYNLYIHLLVNEYLKIFYTFFFLYIGCKCIHLIMEGVSHSLSKTPDLILTFFNGQHILYELVNVEKQFLKDI